MFEKDDYKISIINRDGLELKGYYKKVNDDKCVVAFCGFGGNYDKSFCTLAEKCIENNVSFLFGNTQGSYVKNEMKQHLTNNEVVIVEKGAFNEDFDECVKDLSEWISFAEQEGFKELYIVGASIACNRIVNYLNKFSYPDIIKKIILQCPQDIRPQVDEHLLREAELYVSQNLYDHILTDKFFGYCDITAKTCYNLAHNNELNNLPYLTNGDFNMLKSIKLPIRVIIGSIDEGIVYYSDKDAKYFMDILKNNSCDLSYTIIEGGRHNFKNKEEELAIATIKYVLKWYYRKFCLQARSICK